MNAQEDEHCANHIILTLTSVNVGPGCHFSDFGGLDPSIYIYDLFGNILINNEVEDMGQVTSPMDSISFDVSSNPNCCGGGYSQTLGIFPIDEVEFSFQVEIFESDGGCCEGYNGDDSYAEDIIVMNIIDDAIGTIDVGSCISFNYELEITQIYKYGRSEYIETVCSDFTIEFNDVEYGMDYPQGRDTIWGGSENGCDSFINVMLDFYDEVDVEIQGDPQICFDETDVLGLTETYESYEWNTGSTDAQIAITGPGLFIVTVSDDTGCTALDVLLVEYYPDFFPTIVGPTEFCTGDQAVLSVDGNFVSYEWSSGEDTDEIIVTEGGQYVVSVVNDAGCVAENIYDINEVVLPVPDLLGDPVICFEGSTTLTADGLYANFNWSTGETSSTILVTEPGIYSVTVNNTLGCKSENQIEVVEREEYITRDTVYTCASELVGDTFNDIVSPENCTGRNITSTLLYGPIPSYTATPNTEIISGLPVLLYMDIPNAAGDVTIDWYNGENELICEGCTEMTVTPNETTEYVAVVKYHPECEFREIVEVVVKSNTNIYIPNIFSPDLLENKTFQIYGVDVEQVLTFNVYDRWGNLVFEDKGIDAFWNGRKNGLKLSNGVYVYYIEVVFFDGSSKTLVGDITLIE